MKKKQNPNLKFIRKGDFGLACIFIGVDCDDILHKGHE
jgi:hypothetical protein